MFLHQSSQAPAAHLLQLSLSPEGLEGTVEESEKVVAVEGVEGGEGEEEEVTQSTQS